MKQNLLLLFSVIVIAFSSCEKSYSPGGVTSGGSSSGGTTGGGTTTTSPLLLKLVGISGTDTSSIDTYSYDANNRFITYSAYSKDVTQTPVSIQTTNYIISRNSSGNITQFTQQTITNGTAANSPVPHVLHYPSGSNNCDYEVAKQDIGGGVIYRDSIVFKYSGNVITGYSTYSQIDGIIPYSLYSTTTFTYDSKGNTSLIKLTVLNATGGVSGVADFTYKYDDKNNPLNFGNEMIYLGQSMGVTKNNITNYDIKIVGSSTTTVNFVFNYNYNSISYPTSGNATATGNIPVYPSSVKMTYIYK
jgi:hypothetical protein